MSLEPPPSLLRPSAPFLSFFLFFSIVAPFAEVIAGYLGSEAGRLIPASCWSLTLSDGNGRFGRFCADDQQWKEGGGGISG